MRSVVTDFRSAFTAFEAPLDARLAFLRRTYVHVAGSAIAFVAVSALFQTVALGETVYGWIAAKPLIWLGFLAAFAGIGMLSQSMARSHRSGAAQYGGLAFYVGAWAVLFSPLIFLASLPQFGNTLPVAAGLTILAFGALSAFVLTTRKDFTFLRPFLVVASLVAIGLIACSLLFSFNLGIWFSGAMILLAIGSILYSTSKMVHVYRTDEHVAAALELFAGVAVLFWYVLTLLMQLNRRN